MKNLCIVLVVSLASLSASAQKVYFMYFQSDDNSSFYVRLGDKVYSSTAPGYVIVPNLVDTTYNFSIGIAPNTPETRFSVPLKAKDRGFLIRNNNGEWNLFDLQDLILIKPQIDPNHSISYEKRTDRFTTLLAKAADDPEILYVPVKNTGKSGTDDNSKNETVAHVEEKHQEEKHPVEKKPEIKIDKDSVKQGTEAIAKNPQPEIIKDSMQVVTTTTSAKKDTATGTAVITVPEQKAPETNREATAKTHDASDSSTRDLANHTANTVEEKPVKDNSEIEIASGYKKSQVTKHAESSTTQGFGLIYFDRTETGIDTINLIIPNPKWVFRQPDTASKQDEKQFIEITKEPRTSKDTIQSVSDQPTSKILKPSENKCTSVATDNDFFKLRKNMAARTSDEAMVAEAKRFFKNKCYTTEQIRNLSTLFLTSAGKYLFFDAAYFHVSDQDRFAGLQTEIKDDYYSRRFKALIGE